MNNPNRSAAIFFFAAVMLVISGCASLRPATDPLQDQKAFFLANQTSSLNRHILASRGTGWARLETQTKTQTFKLAWAAVFPDKIRITFLVSGLPVETIVASDGNITFFSHTGKHAKHSYRSKDPDMTRYINVPVKMSEIIQVLLGRFPLKNYDDAYFSPQDPSRSTIVLKQSGTGRSAQYLHFIDSRIDTLEFLNNMGKPVYKMTVLNYQARDFSDIPATIEIKDMDNRKLVLEIISFQPNPPVKESVFQLTETG